MPTLRHAIQSLNQASHTNGNSRLGVLKGYIRSRRPPNLVGFTEHFDLSLHDESIVSRNERDHFIGRRASAILDRRLNRPESRVLANDKIVCYQVLQSLGIPIPQTLASYHPRGRRIAGERQIGARDELENWLGQLTEPVFAKPNHGTYGRLARGIRRFDVGQRTIEFLDGTGSAIDSFVEEISEPAFDGHLFQRILANAAPLQRLIGPTLSTVRLILVVTPEGPVPHLAFWKVASAGNMTDNFSYGRTGNLLCAIDLANGRITHAIKRLGPGGDTVEHPTTGQRMVGFSMPFWRELIDLACRVSAHFPGLRLQNWDVALTDDGPVLIELNTEANLEVPQAISHRGLLSGPAGAFLRSTLTQA